MKLSPDLRGCRVRKKHWASDEWWKLLFIGLHIVVVTDQKGKEHTFTRDYGDNEYELIKEDDEGEKIEIVEGPETTENGQIVE